MAAQAQSTGTKVKKAKVAKRTFAVSGNPDDGFTVAISVGKTTAITLQIPTEGALEEFLWRQFKQGGQSTVVMPAQG